jgi:hypothetical protein
VSVPEDFWSGSSCDAKRRASYVTASYVTAYDALLQYMMVEAERARSRTTRIAEKQARICEGHKKRRDEDAGAVEAALTCLRSHVAGNAQL